MTLREFPRKHLTLAGLIAVAVPLAILLAVQYSALARLQETSPAASRLSQETRLTEVARAIDEEYLVEARQHLDVPAAAIRYDADKDDVSWFATAPSTGVKRYFLASLRNRMKAVVTIYDPATGRVEPVGENADSWAIFSAAVHSMNMMMEPAIVDPNQVEIDAKDPNNRIAIKPIVDEHSRIVGAAGLVVDTKYFETNVLPELAAREASEHFSESELAELNVTVTDENGASRFNTCGHSCGSADVRVPLGFTFSNWTIGLVPNGPSQSTLAWRYFVFNISLSAVMTLILVGAVLISLRAASREMRLSEMKGDFVSNVSHELRTPIASIRVFGELLKMGNVTDHERVREYGAMIESESRRLTQLVNNILDFAQIESGRRTYRFEPADVIALVDDTVAAFKPQASQLGFRVTFEHHSKGPLVVPIDSDAFAQALLNLLDNAVKYSGDSRVVSVHVEEEPGAVVVSVSDSGIGIPPEEHEHIFNRFHRVSTSLVHDIKGSGLGLALVKHIVEAHGGKVSVTSRPGAGSTFAITLPSSASQQFAAERTGVVAERWST